MRPPPFVIRQVAQHLERTQQRAHANAEQQQAKLLARIVARYRDTDLGRELGLSSVHDVASFRSVVPTQLPADYVPRWNAAKEHNRPGMVHPKRLEFMGLSSGTSGVDKFIPFPDEQFANFRLFTNHAFFHAFHALNDATLLAKNILVTSGPPIREVTHSGITIGYGSGLATLKAPRFARQLVRPTRAVLEIPAWGDKIRAMVDEAIDLDIRVLTGVPNSVVPLLEQLLSTARARGREVRCAKDVWPNLRVYAYSGSTLTMWEARLRELLGEGVAFFEVYSSTEAPVAYQHRVGEPGLLLDLLTGYHEFEPVGGPAGVRVGVSDLEVGGLYDIVVTGPGGIFAYKLGDRVEVLSRDPYVIRFAGRDREEINIGVERLALTDVRAALMGCAADEGLVIHQFLVCPTAPSTQQLLTHEYAIELGTPAPAGFDAQRFVAKVDARLAAGNKMYQTSRRGDAIMRPPVLRVMPRGTIERYVLEHLTFGQGKVVHLYSSRAVPEQIFALADRLASASPESES